jgi:EAL domain-containing protein (putative c-di-GMP-specific phosphodiesterase class I)
MTTEVRERIAMTEDLRKALAGGELELDYQPLVELSSGRVFGMEALMRWNRPLHGRLEPDAFLPIAERTGMIVQFGHWALQQACRQMNAWQAAGITLPMMTVNLSLGQLKTGDALVDDVTATLAEFGVAPASIEFDVMEAVLAGLTSAQSDVLEKLHNLGVHIALDDFGSELSSLNYLRKYHVDHLKICRPFVQTATTDARSAAAIRAIVGLARDLNIGIIAEGVETADQRKLLMSMSAQASAQGFFFGHPLAPEGATEVLRRKVIRPPSTLTGASVVTVVPVVV